MPIPNKILFGCVYIPPENTRYSSDNAFHELEGEMITFSRNSKHIFLLGDFNSRTSKMLARTRISGNTHSVFMLIYVFMLIRAPVMYIMYLYDVLLLHIVMRLSVTE